MMMMMMMMMMKNELEVCTDQQGAISITAVGASIPSYF